jgi:Ca-activated chloride channel family protein
MSSQRSERSVKQQRHPLLAAVWSFAALALLVVSSASCGSGGTRSATSGGADAETRGVPAKESKEALVVLKDMSKEQAEAAKVGLATAPSASTATFSTLNTTTRGLASPTLLPPGSPAQKPAGDDKDAGFFAQDLNGSAGARSTDPAAKPAEGKKAETLERYRRALSERESAALPGDAGPNSAFGLGGGGGGGRKEATKNTADRARHSSSNANGVRDGVEKGDSEKQADAATDLPEDPAVRALITSTERIYSAREGELWSRPIIKDDGTVTPAVAFPLKHTAVKASIAGYVGTTTVKQSYLNDFDKPIEAVYVFPLPQDSAVNGFEMVIGDRHIIGLIRKREEAKAIYDRARSEGYTASLLEQERPNIFTQSVANIAAKSAVDVEITYFNRLKRSGGTYEYNFPMVVGPRYMGHTADAARINPPAIPEGMRNGHNISLSLDVDAGMPVNNIACPTHDTTVTRGADGKFTCALKDGDNIPNRDFVLRFDVVGAEYHTGVVTTAGESGGFVSLMFTPPQNLNEVDLTPREITFVLDISGSMSGTPIDLSKRLINNAIDKLRPRDYFNIFFFAGSNGQLWETPKANNAENVATAKEYLTRMKAGGGTEMLAGLRRLFASPKSGPGVLRMVVFLTDGYVGAESEILAEVKKNVGDSRFYAFGIGSSVNGYLIDGVGKHGRGHSVIVLPREDGGAEKAVDEFYSRIDAPCLTDITLDWGGLPVKEQYPSKINDVFATHPVTVVAKYDNTARVNGVVKVRARKGGLPVEYDVKVELPSRRAENSGIEAIWARAKIEQLMDDRLDAANGRSSNDYTVLTNAITDVALAHHLVSEGTSFVAVDDSVRVGDGKPTKIEVPVEQPEGVKRETTRGADGKVPVGSPTPTEAVPAPAAPRK